LARLLTMSAGGPSSDVGADEGHGEESVPDGRIRVSVGGKRTVLLASKAWKKPRLDMMIDLHLDARTEEETLLSERYEIAGNATNNLNNQRRGLLFEILGNMISWTGFRPMTEEEWDQVFESKDPSAHQDKRTFYQGLIQAQHKDTSDGTRGCETGRGDRFWIMVENNPTPDQYDELSQIEPIKVEADEKVQVKNGTKKVNGSKVTMYKTVEKVSAERMGEVRARYAKMGLVYIEVDTKSTRLTIEKRAAGAVYSVQFRDLKKYLDYCDFFDLFLELPGYVWTGLLSVHGRLALDQGGEDAVGKGGAKTNVWKHIKEKEAPYLSGEGLQILADPATSGDHKKMIESIIDQLNWLCVRPGSTFSVPTRAQMYDILEKSTQDE